MEGLTWTCHICGDTRPDERISVLSKPLEVGGRIAGEQNIRYCNDRQKCIDGAKDFSFFNKEESSAPKQTLERRRHD